MGMTLGEKIIARAAGVDFVKPNDIHTVTLDRMMSNDGTTHLTVDMYHNQLKNPKIADKIEGLDAGANDYMEKPFHLQELEARVRSLTRRKFIQKNVCLECNGIRFDIRERVAYAEENPVALTRKENGILEYLLLNQGRPVSQEELIEHVWDSSVDSFSGSIRVHMSSLRRKLKAGLGYDPIVNRIGEGYKIGGDSKA